MPGRDETTRKCNRVTNPLRGKIKRAKREYVKRAIRLSRELGRPLNRNEENQLKAQTYRKY